MYQQPAQQTGVQSFPSQQPAAASTQGHGSPAQPSMYQVPGQQQPVFTGQPAMGQQGQPLQYYAPAGQPGQPVHFQGAPAQPPVNQEFEEEVTTLQIDMKYVKSLLFFSRFFEIVSISVNRKGGHDGCLPMRKKQPKNAHLDRLYLSYGFCQLILALF